MLGAKESFKTIFQLAFEIDQPFSVVEIFDVSDMPQIEWHIVRMLCDEDDFTSQGVGYSGFIEHVRIAISEIAYYDTGSINQ